MTRRTRPAVTSVDVREHSVPLDTQQFNIQRFVRRTTERRGQGERQNYGTTGTEETQTDADTSGTDAETSETQTLLMLGETFIF